MVNAAVGAIHSVRKDNVVVAGGSPFALAGPQGQGRAADVHEAALCLSTGRNPKPVCRKRVRFDVWAHHPYTSGDPTHHANGPDDVSASDLWKMRVLLDAAVRAGTLQSRGGSVSGSRSSRGTRIRRTRKACRRSALGRRGPLPHVESGRQSRHLVHAARPAVYTSTPFQAGLYFRGEDGVASDKPKMALTAFRFPFVAFRQPAKKSVMYWGRSPAGARP